MHFLNVTHADAVNQVLRRLEGKDLLFENRQSAYFLFSISSTAISKNSCVSCKPCHDALFGMLQ